MNQKWVVGKEFALFSGEIVTMGEDVDLDQNPLILANGERIDEKRALKIAKETCLRLDANEGSQKFNV
jgi:hypothetical protein